MHIRYVTITGVDSRTNIHQLLILAERYPFVEWGFLYSPSRAGNENRYMSLERLANSVLYTYPALNLSLHLCGKGVDEFIHDTLPFDLEFERVQLNFNAQKERGWEFDELVEECSGHPHIQFITQDNVNNRDVLNHFYQLPNHAMLWDASGGMGRSDNILPKPGSPPRGVFYGFAGGITPENVNERLQMYEQWMGQNSIIWIDMESGVRTDDWLDLSKVEQVLKTVEDFGK